MRRVQHLEGRYERLGTEGTEHIRWMVEELRVSLFAQTLGTAHPVSEKRILRAMEDWAAGGGRGRRPFPSR
jgi:ATP-dependent helicase HrpA